jgi:transposase
MWAGRGNATSPRPRHGETPDDEDLGRAGSVAELPAREQALLHEETEQLKEALQRRTSAGPPVARRCPRAPSAPTPARRGRSGGRGHPAGADAGRSARRAGGGGGGGPARPRRCHRRGRRRTSPGATPPPTGVVRVPKPLPATRRRLNWCASGTKMQADAGAHERLGSRLIWRFGSLRPGALGPDELWELSQRVVPPAPSWPQGGGRRRYGDREVLAAIVFVATSGCTWRQLPPSRRPRLLHPATTDARPKRHSAGLSLYQAVRDLQTLLATWTGACFTCHRDIPTLIRT